VTDVVACADGATANAASPSVRSKRRSTLPLCPNRR
jgi:hypothetical protein